MTPALEASSGAVEAWRLVTHLGSVSLLLPTLAITAAGLHVSGQVRALCVWLSALAAAAAATTLSKILFFGWGIGSATLDFTGISGHTLLATAILPILFSWLLTADKGAPGGRLRFAGFALGLAISAAVAVSRVVLGAHSPSEVVSGGLLGLAVSAVTLKAMHSQDRRPWFALLAPAVLLLASGQTASNFIPTHQWEVRLALFMSGREAAYTRQQLHSLKHLSAPSPALVP